MGGRGPKTRHRGAEWLDTIPVVGGEAKEAWERHLGNPRKLQGLIGDNAERIVLVLSGDIGGELPSQMIKMLVTFITLFVLYRDGDRLKQLALGFANYMLGDRGHAWRTRWW